MAYCKSCGSQLRVGARFCNDCGALVTSRGKSPKRSKTATKNAKSAGREAKRRSKRPEKPVPQADKTGKPIRPAKAPKSPVPDDLLPLLRYIGAKTMATFFKRLPLTIAVGVGAWALHTFLLVYINEGFSGSTMVGQILALKGQFVSGSVVWMVGSALLMGVLTRLFGRPSGVSLKDRIEAIKRYLTEARSDAYSVVSGGVGIALVLAALITSSGSLVLAVGVGALIASRAGSVISLLFRTAWNTLFTTVRRQQIRHYGMAAGYAGLFASSLGFALNSVLPAGGFFIGLVLLGLALFFGRQGHVMAAGKGLWLLLGGAAVSYYLLGDATLVLAHDGGWREAGGTFQGWINSQGAATAVMIGIGPAVGASIGAAFGTTLTTIGNTLPPDDFSGEWPADVSEAPPDFDEEPRETLAPADVFEAPPDFDEEPRWPTIIDPYDGTAFETDADGNYWAPDAKGEWGWLSESEAREAAAAMQAEIKQRAGEVVHHDEETKRIRKEWHTAWEARSREEVAERQAELRESGQEYDSYTERVRPLPEMPELGDVPVMEGDTIEWKPAWWGLWGYNASTDKMEKALDDLDSAGEVAQKAYSGLTTEIAQAEADGDPWLADHLRDNLGRVRDRIGEIQNQKTNIIDPVRAENQRVADFDQRAKETEYDSMTMGAEVVYGAAQLIPVVGLVFDDPHFVENVSKGIEAAERVRKGNGVELRPGLIGYDTVKTGPSIAEKFEDAVANVADLSELLQEAQAKGDTHAIDHYTRELGAAKEEAEQLSEDLQQHVKDIDRWRVRSASANITMARKGTHIAGEGVAVLPTGRWISDRVAPIPRAQPLGFGPEADAGPAQQPRGPVRSGLGIDGDELAGSGRPSIPKIKVKPGGTKVGYDIPGDESLPKIKIKPGGTTVDYASPLEKPPADPRFYPPGRRPDLTKPIEKFDTEPPPPPRPSARPPEPGIETDVVHPVEIGKVPKDADWVGDLSPQPPGQRPPGFGPEVEAPHAARPPGRTPSGDADMPGAPKPQEVPEGPATQRPAPRRGDSDVDAETSPSAAGPRSDPKFRAIDEVHAHLENNPAQKGDRFINMTAERANQMQESGRLQPASQTGGESDVTYATSKGAGPAGYTGDDATHVVRVPAENTVDVWEVRGGRFLDANGNEIPLDSLKGKIIARRAPEGTGDTLTYMTPEGRLTPDIPKELVKRWSTTEKDWV